VVFIAAYGSELSKEDELWRPSISVERKENQWEHQEPTDPQRVVSLVEQNGIREVKLSKS